MVMPAGWWGSASSPKIPLLPRRGSARHLRRRACGRDRLGPVLHTEARSIDRLVPAVAPARAAEAAVPPRLHHPLGEIKARQIALPLERKIVRIGSAPALRKPINLADARLNRAAAGAVWPLSEHFPHSHFLDLSDAEPLSRPHYEERNSGLGMGTARGSSMPRFAGTPCCPVGPQANRCAALALGTAATAGPAPGGAGDHPAGL